MQEYAKPMNQVAWYVRHVGNFIGLVAIATRIVKTEPVEIMMDELRQTPSIRLKKR